MGSPAIVLLLGVANLASVGAVSGRAPATPQVVVTDQSEVSEQLAAFESALEAWQAKLDATKDRAERRALKKAHPAKALAPDQIAFARAHSGEAARWCLEQLRNLGLGHKEREALREELYGLLADAKDAELRTWAAEELIADSALARRLGTEKLSALVDRFVARESAPERQGHVRALFAKKLQRSRDEHESARGLAVLRELIADEGLLDEDDRAWVKELLNRIDFLSIGATAPLFSGATVDGDPIALEDFRGKVTVLSFFGFW